MSQITIRGIDPKIERRIRKLAKQKMIAALQRLQQSVRQPHLPDQLAAFGISGGIGQGMKRLFMSHPPLEERIAALQASI